MERGEEEVPFCLSGCVFVSEKERGRHHLNKLQYVRYKLSTVTKDHKCSFLCVVSVLYVSPGKDVATSVEVYWPDGLSVARPLEPSEINSVLEIHYPRNEEDVTPTVEIEVQQYFIMLLKFHYLL